MAHRPLIHGLVAGAIAPLALLLIGPAPAASASCGDHVRILPVGPGVAPLSAHQTAAGSRDEGSPVPSPGSPCHGPGCHQAPPSPMPQAPPSPTTAHPHDAVLASAASVAPAGFGLLTLEAPVSPRVVTDPIFHPPRS